MKIKIYSDGSNFDQMVEIYKTNNLISGFTTNPSLMKKAGVKNYLNFVTEITQAIKDLPISFEIFADEYVEMKEQIFKLSSISHNIYVKVPVSNTKGEPTYELCREMSDLGIKLNVTAVFTKDQIDKLNEYLNPNIDSIISIFCGRIADTGIDPATFIKYALKTKKSDKHKILWASTREVYNIYEADKIGCDIITISPELINKLSLFGKDLNEYSIETVRMFYNDAMSLNYKL